MNLLVILNEKYFALVEKTCGQLRKPAQYCAAKLIHYFANWAKWKKQVQRTEWIYQKLKDIKADLMHEHSLHQIREAIAALIEAEILERRNNPGNGQDRTHQYRVNTKALNVAVATRELQNSDPNVEDSTGENQPKDPYRESNQKNPIHRTGEDLENLDCSQQETTPPATGQMGKEDDVPTDLKTKLEELEIPLDKKVRTAIASHHISQAWGAVNHVENTWSTIDNPRSVFLYQIGKQSVERMGSQKEYRVSQQDGYTLEHIKWLYPNSWKQAAKHFGIEIEDDI